jgi:peroxiredoxin
LWPKHKVMKKTILLLFLSPLFGLTQEPAMNFTITGIFKNAPKDVVKILLTYTSGSDRRTDSSILTNGKYSFSGKIAEPVLATLRVGYAPQADGKARAAINRHEVAPVFLDKGKISVTSTDSMSNVSVKGSKAHTEYEKLDVMAKSYSARQRALFDQYNKYKEDKNEEGMKKIESEFNTLETEKSEKVYGDYLRNNPGSPVALYALKQYAGWDMDPGKVEPFFNTLPAEVQQLPSAVEMKEKIETARKTAIGREAIDFTQNDTLGIPVSLSSFRGKYILVDFWASWCGPCRHENPNVVKAFHQFKEKGFHILSVSLDRPGQKEKWMKAIHDDRLEWTHVSDLKFWENEVAVQYGIQAIPQNILVNPEGKIVAKNLRGEELDKKLEEFIVEGKKAF